MCLVNETSLTLYEHSLFDTAESAGEEEEGETCECNIPCEQIHYNPRLSYAVLSSINVERFIIRSEEERRELQVSTVWGPGAAM